MPPSFGGNTKEEEVRASLQSDSTGLMHAVAKHILGGMDAEAVAGQLGRSTDLMASSLTGTLAMTSPTEMTVPYYASMAGAPGMAMRVLMRASYWRAAQSIDTITMPGGPKPTPPPRSLQRLRRVFPATSDAITVPMIVKSPSFEPRIFGRIARADDIDNDSDSDDEDFIEGMVLGLGECEMSDYSDSTHFGLHGFRFYPEPPVVSSRCEQDEGDTNTAGEGFASDS